MGGPGPWFQRLIILGVFHLVGLLLCRFLRLRVHGVENIPKGGGVLFLSNHISAVDVVAIPWCIYQKFPEERLWKLAKEELFHVPFIGWVIRKLRALPVKRGSADLSTIRLLEKHVREDKVILYPEGSRSKDGRIGPGNRMVGRIILNTKPKVVPVAVKGTNRAVPVGRFFPRPGVKIEVTFGMPLELWAEYTIENRKESSVRIVEKVMRAISSLLDEENQAKPARSTEVIGS